MVSGWKSEKVRGSRVSPLPGHTVSVGPRTDCQTCWTDPEPLLEYQSGV